MTSSRWRGDDLRCTLKNKSHEEGHFSHEAGGPAVGRARAGSEGTVLGCTSPDSRTFEPSYRPKQCVADWNPTRSDNSS